MAAVPTRWFKTVSPPTWNKADATETQATKRPSGSCLTLPRCWVSDADVECRACRPQADGREHVLADKAGVFWDISVRCETSAGGAPRSLSEQESDFLFDDETSTAAAAVV
ncbi:hypothetical protein B2J93_5982 [Marssonina coronariae]|uniref:Uncharacterized protein n=1 Tax=Diplocarpon coronariae TaxID=2795749 RepID=A0A218Z8F4_9HELO|nr:hypothetical protein B2J93_5982 [Marssonina coronariae]